MRTLPSLPYPRRIPSPTTSFVPSPSLSPPSLPQAREAPEDRLGQVALQVAQTDVAVEDTGERGREEAHQMMRMLTWLHARADVPQATCARACVEREREGARRCPRTSQPAVRKCVCVHVSGRTERQGRKGETCRGADGGKDRQDKRTEANQMCVLRTCVCLSPLSPAPSPTYNSLRSPSSSLSPSILTAGS